MKGSFEVLKLCVEVAPLNMEARDDINLSIQQLINQNSSGISNSTIVTFLYLYINQLFLLCL